MSKRPPLRKSGCTFDEYHSLLKHCHGQRQNEKGDTAENEWLKVQQQQQPTFRRPTTAPSYASLEDIPYLEQQQSPSPKDRSSPETRKSRPRFSSQTSHQGPQPEQVPAFDSWDNTRNSNSIGFDSWASPKSPVKNRPSHSWTDTAHTSQTQKDHHHTRPDQGTDQAKVKLIKPERFKDLQIEAINHWTNGIDLDLEKPQEKKGKKLGWLTLEELAKFSSTKKEPVANPLNSSVQSMPATPSHESKPIDNVPVVYATNHHQYQQPTIDNNDASHVISRLISNLPSDTYLFLDIIQNHRFGQQSLPVLAKGLPHILTNLPDQDNQTVEKLVSTLVMALNDKLQATARSDKQLITDILHNYTNDIMDTITRYIQSYIITPSHFTLILDFFLSFSRERPATTFPLYILHEQYTELRDLFLPGSCNEIKQHLAQLETYNTNSINQINHQTMSQTHQNDQPSHQIMEKEHSVPFNRIRQYLQHQLVQHEHYLTDLKNEAIQLATSSKLLPGSNWIVLRNARRYPPMVCSPVIPDTATVYSYDDNGKSNQLNSTLIGCIAFVLPTTRSTTKQPALIGTTIQYANGDTSKSLVAVKHGDYLGYDKTYTLVLTSTSATELLPLVDWIRYASTHLNENDFSSDLFSNLITLEENGTIETTDVPDYLVKVYLDVSTVLTPNYRGCKANVSENSWPQLQSKHLRLPPDRRPLVYTLSPSQVSCLQYALSHRFAIVSGGPGTGKTFLAGKLLELSYQALKKGYIHQPILVMAPSTTALASLLGSVAQPPLAQDMVFFGDDDDQSNQNRLLATRDGLQLSVLCKGSAAWKEYRRVSRDLETYHMKIKCLEQHRQQVIVEKDPRHVADLMPPSYRLALMKKDKNLKNAGWLWLGEEDSENHTGPSIQTYSRLLDNITHKVSNLQPIVKRTDFLQQQQWMDTHPPLLQPLSEGRHWPFQSMHDSYLRKAGEKARGELFKIWTMMHACDLWNFPVTTRRQLYSKVLKCYATHVDKMLKYLIEKQETLLATLNRLRIAQWQATAKFNRVVGMTTGFAMANQAFVRELSPLVVIIDDAQSVSGPFLAATGMTSGAEHLILLGNKFSDPWQRLKNQATLTDQWRMELKVFEMWQTALDQKETLMIPDMIKKPKSSVRGIKTPTFMCAYSGSDYCLFVAHLALYLYQQDYSASDLAILTNNPIDRLVLEKHVAQLAQFTPFSTGLETVLVDCVDTFKGEERDLVLLIVDSSYSLDQVSTALSSARKGLYVIGSDHYLTTQDPWIRLADFMKDQGLYSSKFPLQCKVHSDTETWVASPDDFSKVRNGGCSTQCKTLMSCGHVCQENCHHRSHSLVKCLQPCERTRPTNCIHACKNKCHECQSACPPCSESFTLLLPCDHRVNIQCNEQDQELSKIRCHEMVPVTLGCGHTIKTHCHKVSSAEYTKVKCTERVDQVLKCGHTAQTTCGVSSTCAEQCNQLLECGHPCQQMCYTDHDHDRKQCTFGCPKQLICGHQCAKGCANPDNHTERCLNKCERLCSHGYKCDRMCWESCIKCMSPCSNECLHGKCTLKCHEICNRDPCDEPCLKTLECSHPCKSTCGEPCSTCPICHPDTQCPITLRPLSEFSPDEKIYTLPDCGCSFSLEGLDQYFCSRYKNGEHTAIKQRTCPSCQKSVYTATRYHTHVQTELNLIDAVKKHQETKLAQLTDDERYNIINAMNEESLSSNINNIVGGRWFVCKNQHPYFIGDCGGATEVSKCPQCNETIGGLQHQVIDTNRFYGEFDGSAEPAWPGQPRS